jgi:iron(III) transport system substrate-binding protein
MTRRLFGQPSPSFGTDRRGRSLPLWLPTLVVLGIVAVLFTWSRRLADRLGAVVVYTSQDQVYSEPILRDFERETGIRVRAVYDSEAVKAVGLVNRLLAEQAHPQCDVFWNNEELRIRQLAARGVLAEDPPWAAIGHRSRRVVINTNQLELASAPRSLLELTNAVWRGRVALAYPLFGTTATHFLALRQHWGEAGWQEWCRALQANQPFVVDGNSVVVRLVGQGQAAIGLTDSDDIAAGQREGYPIVAQPLNEETLLIPNAVAIVRGAPRPRTAVALLDYLRAPGTVRRLVEANALESADPEGPRIGIEPDWPDLLAGLETNTAFLKQVFLR